MSHFVTEEQKKKKERNIRNTTTERNEVEMLVCIGKAYEKHKFLTATERLMYAYIVYERKAFRMTILSISTYSLTHIHTPL